MFPWALGSFQSNPEAVSKDDRQGKKPARCVDTQIIHQDERSCALIKMVRSAAKLIINCWDWDQ